MTMPCASSKGNICAKCCWRNRGNQCKAAEELGIHRNTLSRTMAELGLSLAEVRAGLKRPPRSERPVFGAARQGFRQG